MPDVCGYWDRRADDPDYIRDDIFGGPIFRDRKKEQEEEQEKLAEDKKRYIGVLGELKKLFPEHKRTLSKILKKLE